MVSTICPTTEPMNSGERGSSTLVPIRVKKIKIGSIPSAEPNRYGRNSNCMEPR